MEKAAKRDCATELTRVYSTPIGPLKLVANAEGICTVKFLFGKQQSSPRDDGSHEVIGQKGSGKDTKHTSHSQGSVPSDTASPEERKALGHLEVCINWLDAYFDGSLLKLSPPKPPLVFPTEGNVVKRVEYIRISVRIGLIALNMDVQL